MRKKHCSRLEIYDRSGASEQTAYCQRENARFCLSNNPPTPIRHCIHGGDSDAKRSLEQRPVPVRFGRPKPLLFLVAAAAFYSHRQLATARPKRWRPQKEEETRSCCWSFTSLNCSVDLSFRPSFSLVPNSNGSGTLFLLPLAEGKGSGKKVLLRPSRTILV